MTQATGRTPAEGAAPRLSNAEIEQVVVLDGSLARLGPSVPHPGIGVWPIDEGGLVRKALPARIDAVADHLGAFVNALLIVDAFGVVHTAALDTQHRAPSMKAHLHRDPPIPAGVGKGSVQRLAIGDRHVAWLGNDRDRLG